MPIRVACPSCSYTDTVPDEAAGKQIKCPHCRVPLVIGSKEPESPKATPKRIPAHSVKCPTCQSRFMVDTSLAGKTVKCRDCQEPFRIPDKQLHTDESSAEDVLPADDDDVEPTQGNSRLRRCPDCGKMISKRAPACPQCGCPNNKPYTTSHAPKRNTLSGIPVWILTLIGVAFLVISLIAHDIINSMNNHIVAEIRTNPYFQGNPVDRYTHSYTLAWLLAGTGVFLSGLLL